MFRPHKRRASQPGTTLSWKKGELGMAVAIDQLRRQRADLTSLIERMERVATNAASPTGRSGRFQGLSVRRRGEKRQAGER